MRRRTGVKINDGGGRRGTGKLGRCAPPVFYGWGKLLGETAKKGGAKQAGKGLQSGGGGPYGAAKKEKEREKESLKRDNNPKGGAKNEKQKAHVNLRISGRSKITKVLGNVVNLRVWLGADSCYREIEERGGVNVGSF